MTGAGRGTGLGLLAALCILAAGPPAPAEPAGSPRESQPSAPLPPAEPDDYRLDNYRSPVPLTLRGGEVVDTASLARRLADSQTIIVDVLPQELRPPKLAPDNVWLPPAHAAIPGAVWLPNVGYGRLPPPLLAYFTDSLRRITGGDQDRPLVFYCRANCWMSWNAARRALSLGYRRVLWYPDGIDAWQAAGNPTSPVKPFGTPPGQP